MHRRRAQNTFISLYNLTKKSSLRFKKVSFYLLILECAATFNVRKSTNFNCDTIKTESFKKYSFFAKSDKPTMHKKSRCTKPITKDKIVGLRNVKSANFR